MNLHKNKNDFINLIQETTDHFGISDYLIEKDYWITYFLRNLSQSELKEKFIFKGGTSLSKAYRMIDRFSEDLDFILKKEHQMSNSQKKSLARKAQKVGQGDILTEKTDPKTSKGSLYRRTSCQYPSIISHSQNSILLEFNSFSSLNSVFEIKEIRSYIAQMLYDKQKGDVINSYNLNPFDFQILSPKFTFCEKLVCLMMYSSKENRIDELISKNRHFYDISEMLENDEIKKYLKGNEIGKYLSIIYENDRNNKKNEKLTSSSILKIPLFSEMDYILEKVYSSFKGDFQNLLINKKVVDFKEFQKSFQMIRKTLSRKS